MVEFYMKIERVNILVKAYNYVINHWDTSVNKSYLDHDPDNSWNNYCYNDVIVDIFSTIKSVLNDDDELQWDSCFRCYPELFKDKFLKG